MHDNRDANRKYERVRHVTLPTLKQEVGQPLFVRADSEIFEGQEREGKDGEKVKPARVIAVTNLETGEQGQMVLGTVLEGNLSEKYPNKSYVGKCFEIVKGPKPERARYHLYELYEIADPGTKAKSLNDPAAPAKKDAAKK